MSSPEKVVFHLPQGLVVGEFEIIIKDEIGQGGFGSVYLLEYEGEEFAAKLYRIWEILPDERIDIQKRIYQEFQISEIIDSPHVVKILTYEEVLGNPFLIMEYCEGGNIRDLVEQGLGHSELRKLIKDVCQGLQAMHQQDIIHRDIKPENILQKGDDYAITDFGISANLHHRITQTDILGKAKQLFATAAYSPPEQSSGTRAFKNTGPTNDIYALGVLLHEIITRGKLPYGSYEVYEKDPIEYERRKKKVWDQTSLNDTDVDDLWVYIIEGCLQPKISKRFQSVDDILNILPKPKPINFKGYNDLRNDASSWCLIHVLNDIANATFYLSKLAKNKGKSILTIGRYEQENVDLNDVMIVENSSVSVSRYHATLELTTVSSRNEQWTLRDGQWINVDGEMQWRRSTNGTFINGEEIDQEGRILKENDEVKIGSVILTFANI